MVKTDDFVSDQKIIKNHDKVMIFHDFLTSQTFGRIISMRIRGRFETGFGRFWGVKTGQNRSKNGQINGSLEVVLAQRDQF